MGLSDKEVCRLRPETGADQGSGQFSRHRLGLIAALCKRTSCERERDKSYEKRGLKSATPLHNCACEKPLLRECIGLDPTRRIS